MSTSLPAKKTTCANPVLVVILVVAGATFTATAAANDDERTVLLNAAQLALRAGEYEEAEEEMRSVIERSPGKEAGEKAVDLQNLALILYLQAKFQDSTKVYMAALPLTESCWGSRSLAVADNLYGIIRTLRRSGNFPEAEPHILRLVDIRTQHLGNWHKSVGNALMDLAVNYERQGKFDSAEKAYEKALLVKEKQFGQDSRDNIPYLKQYANMLVKSGKSTDELEERIRYLDTKPSTREPPDTSDKSGWLHWPRPADVTSSSIH
jgi:tetratricopeptide (TPR) repeat protein